jgi:NIPSNAP
VEYELRIYTAKPGELDAFVEEWREKVYPLRLASGFELVGAWRAEEEVFVWILGYDGDFETADRAYYDSDARKAITPNPTRHLAHTEHRRLSSVV